MTSPSKSKKALHQPFTLSDWDEDTAAIVAAGLKAELDLQAASQLPPNVRPSWCAGAVCTKPGCQNLVNGHILLPRTYSSCSSCSYTGARNPDCWCGLCFECRPRPIGTGPASATSPS